VPRTGLGRLHERSSTGAQVVRHWRMRVCAEAAAPPTLRHRRCGAARRTLVGGRCRRTDEQWRHGFAVIRVGAVPRGGGVGSLSRHVWRLRILHAVQRGSLPRGCCRGGVLTLLRVVQEQTAACSLVLQRRKAACSSGDFGSGCRTIMTCRLALQLGFRVWGVDQAPKLQLATFFLFVRRSLRRAEEAA